MAAAVAFYLSDVSVARDRFVAPGFGNRIWGLPLYYAAQLLFALVDGLAVKELILLRHAKSDWAAPFADDADRPLNGRGREAAGVMGRVLTLAGRAPDLVLASPAQRARGDRRSGGRRRAAGTPRSWSTPA